MQSYLQRTKIMKENRKDRRNLNLNLNRVSSLGTLPKRPNKLFHISLLLLCILAVHLFSSCIARTTTQDPGSTHSEDPLLMVMKFCRNWGRIRSLDLFIYSQEGIRPLESHIHLDSLVNPIQIPKPEGPAVLVAVANCPYRFNTTAIARLDAMEKLDFQFKDDNPSWPLMSGSCELVSGDQAELQLEPLMCRVILGSISNGMADYVLMEDPCIWLSGMNASATLLQTDGFRPKSSIPEGMKERLPYDIGFYSQSPQTVLYCYPNDTPDNILGVDRTCLNLSFNLQGKEKSLQFDLPPMRRGRDVTAAIVVESEEEYYCQYM